MREEDVRLLVSQMTNFYNDYLPMDSAFVKLLHVYGETIRFLYKDLQQTKDNQFLPTAKTIREIPYFKLDITNGLYDALRARTLQKLELEDMIDEMDRRGEYVSLYFSRSVRRQPIVYAMTLKITFGAQDPLVLYEDYFLRNNKLFLLPSFILNKKRSNHYLHAFDIKVDDKKLEDNWGTKFDLEFGPLLPRYEYREALKGFQKALSGNLSIKDIKVAIRDVTKWEQFDLVDLQSPWLPPAKKRLYDQWIISPSTFIISVPEEIIFDKVRVNLLFQLLDEVKRSETNYIMFYDIERSDEGTPTDEVKVWYKLLPKEQPSTDDRYYKKISFLQTDELFTNQQEFNYDESMTYDERNRYDMSLFQSFDEEETAFEAGEFDAYRATRSDMFLLRHRDFPRIPRQFTFTVTGNPKQVTFTFNSNADGTDQFELYGAEVLEGPYTLLDYVTNDNAAPTVSLFHDANLSGKRYYKLRAMAGSRDSMMTLPLDIGP